MYCNLVVLLLSMADVLGDCCPTSLILKIQDICKSEVLKVSEKVKIRIKITKYIARYERTSTCYVMPKWTNSLYYTLRFYFPYLSFLAQPVTIFV